MLKSIRLRAADTMQEVPCDQPTVINRPCESDNGESDRLSLSANSCDFVGLDFGESSYAKIPKVVQATWCKIWKSRHRGAGHASRTVRWQVELVHCSYRGQFGDSSASAGGSFLPQDRKNHPTTRNK